MLSLLASAVIVLLIMTAAWPRSLHAAEPRRQIDEALVELRAANKEWQQNEGEFRSLRQNKSLPEESVREFAEFVAALRRKMLESCHAFRTAGGDPDKLGFACGLPEEKHGRGEELPQNPRAILTKEEQTAALEAPLTQSLTEFDKTFQEKQDQLRGELANQGSVGYPSTRNRVEYVGKTGSKAGSIGAKQGGSPPHPSDERTQPRRADPGAGPGLPRTAVITSPGRVPGGGNDDDVVARQLREAAEKEQDPLLKEKLWNEYRKYKAS